MKADMAEFQQLGTSDRAVRGRTAAPPATGLGRIVLASLVGTRIEF